MRGLQLQDVELNGHNSINVPIPDNRGKDTEAGQIRLRNV